MVLRAFFLAGVLGVCACGSPSFVGVTPDGGGSADGASSDGGGGGGDGGVATDGGVTSDGATEGGSPDIACLDAGTCPAGTDVCCVYKSTSGDSFSSQCSTTTHCTSTGNKIAVTLTCSQKKDCPGTTDVCCLVKDQGTGDVSSHCVSVAQCNAASGAVMCSITGSALQCVGTQCESANSQWNLPQSYGTCGGR